MNLLLKQSTVIIREALGGLKKDDGAVHVEDGSTRLVNIAIIICNANIAARVSLSCAAVVHTLHHYDITTLGYGGPLVDGLNTKSGVVDIQFTESGQGLL